MTLPFRLAPWSALFFTAPLHAEPAPIPTFNQDIAPLVHASCASCHRPGEAGPFPLLTHDDVSRKARTILRVLEDRSMPPWHATSGDFPFSHDRRLTPEQIQTFAAWTAAGTPRGDGPEPKPPTFPSGWTLGEPDLVLTMPAGFDVPAEGPDIYRNFALRLRLPEDRWVKAIELRPSARGVVHHSLFFLDTTGTAVAEDGKDGRPGFRGMGFRRAGSLGGYVPGSTTQFLPDDYAMPLPKGADLVLSTHFHPSGKPETEQSTVGLYFADAPPSRTLTPVQVPPAFGAGMQIDIPAGESRYVVRDQFTLPVEADALSVGGHAHYLCVSQRLSARFPDGPSRLLLGIDDWDLDWQDRYFFAQPVRLPAGTVLEAELVYDNSAANPDNPFSPPRRVRWGHESTDEMGSITILLSPVPGASASTLTQAVRRSQADVLGSVLSRPRDAFALGLARRLQGLDADGDGRLQSAELPRLHRDRALAFDRDADGSLDDEEISALLDSVRSGPDSPRS